MKNVFLALAAFAFIGAGSAQQDQPVKADNPSKTEIKFTETSHNFGSIIQGEIARYEFHFTNTGTTTLEAVFSFNSKNFLHIDEGQNAIRPVKNGFILTEKGKTDKPQRSDFAIFTNDDTAVVDHCWFRGGWWDPLTMAWNAVKNGETITTPPVEKDAPGASLYVPFTLLPGGKKIIKVLFKG